MDKAKYDSVKSDEEDLIYELALLNFKEDALISEKDIEFMEYIIKEYVDIKEPVLIEDTYVFVAKIEKLIEVYEKALKQIEESKFRCYIFQ